MKLYNTLTKSIDDIQPLNPPEITIYTCGPTVYDYAHIGHWFNYIRMDLLVRTLKVIGLNPKWVMNITDVGHLVSDADEGEDKLEKGARREGKTAWEVAEYYTQDFLAGMKILNMLNPDYIVKATDHIPQQIALIQKLEAKGFTYVIDDGVYFDTSKFPTYAAFAQLDLEEQEAGKRVTLNPQKRGPNDFALWKFSPKNSKRDMEWSSPWGKGFPGWHIECSAMSMAYLGETIDIHTGGIDHIPVHHTNEIAQSEAATGKSFAKHWMHSNHIMVNGKKISKSLGNGVRLQQIFEHNISPKAVRLHVLESHYRNQSSFSWRSLAAAQNRLNDLQAMADLRFQLFGNATDTSKLLDTAKRSISASIQNDLHTPEALAELSALVNSLEKSGIDAISQENLTDFISWLDKLFGLDLGSSNDITQDQKAILRTRSEARKDQDWAKSDQLRGQLHDQGIVVKDTASEQIWSRL